VINNHITVYLSFRHSSRVNIFG